MNPDDSTSTRDATARTRLTREECLRLMASVPVGRVIYTRRALPAVEPVPFFLDGGDIVIGADPSSELADATHNAVVAFETDAIDHERGHGWRVTAIGRAGQITDPREVTRMSAQPASMPWGREHFIRITPGILDGKWLAY